MRVPIAAKSAGSWIRAEWAHKHVRQMIASGMTKAEIARAMGLKCGALKWWGKKKIRVSTWVRLAAVYRNFEQESKEAA